MARVEVLGHSEVYRNPHPNLTSEYVAFPAIQALPDGTLLCMCRHSTARESIDGAVNIHRSTDSGITWGPGGPLPETSDAGPGMRVPGGFGLTRDGQALACVRYPFAGDEKWGPFLSRSVDGGLTWSALQPQDRGPFAGMAVMGNLASTPDGTAVMAAEWSDNERETDRPHWTSLTARSPDDGRTWDAWRRAHQPQSGKYFFDPRITALADGRLLVAYWTHDLEGDQGVNVHTASSADQGETWTQPQDAGFWGQVTDVAGLHSGRVVAVTNHRRPPLGIRVVLSDNGGQWFDESAHVELWGTDPAQVRSAPVLAKRRDVVENALDSYHFFTFGTPSVTQLPSGEIVVAFYVTEEHVTYVRCCRLREID